MTEYCVVLTCLRRELGRRCARALHQLRERLHPHQHAHGILADAPSPRQCRGSQRPSPASSSRSRCRRRCRPGPACLTRGRPPSRRGWRSHCTWLHPCRTGKRQPGSDANCRHRNALDSRDRSTSLTKRLHRARAHLLAECVGQVVRRVGRNEQDRLALLGELDRERARGRGLANTACCRQSVLDSALGAPLPPQLGGVSCQRAEPRRTRSTAQRQ